jgi:hypothetical protein
MMIDNLLNRPEVVESKQSVSTDHLVELRGPPDPENEDPAVGSCGASREDDLVRIDEGSHVAQPPGQAWRGGDV